MKDWLLYVIPVSGVLALIFAFMKASWVKKQEAGTERMTEIAGYVKEGAMAFLKREYTVLIGFVIVVAILLGVSNALGESTAAAYKNPLIALSFVLGATCSGLAGWIGMQVATDANVRTTNAARKDLNGALQVAFSGGTVMGMAVVGLAVVGLGSLLLFYGMFGGVADMTESPGNAYKVVTVLSGFSLGASSIALFARVGGGIYTKAADVGADLVGKVEAGIPEDDPRNPATIADNVGDNVGDVAGMGADLFESYVGSIIGAMVLAVGAAPAAKDFTQESFMAANFAMVILPLIIAALGIVVSIGATYFVKTKEGGDPQMALNIGTFGAAAVMVPGIFALCFWLIPGPVLDR
jgi:K(+)-stimulated pyrophosphate-energized sodium pump